MIRFKTILREGVTFDASTGMFVFDFQTDSETNILHLQYKPKTYVRKHLHHGVTYYYGYELNHKSDKNLRHQFLHALKDGAKSIQPEALEHFINKAIVGLDRTLPVEKLDLIITPKSSSTLVAHIAKKLAANSSNVLLTTDALVKNAIENIRVDYDGYMKNADTDEKRRAYKKTLDRTFAHATESGQFKVKNVFGPLRKFFSNYLIFDSSTSREIFNRIHGGHVLLVDDYVTTGETMEEMLNAVLKYEPASVTIFALIKN